MIIRNIWAVGRNFQAHAQEMNASVPAKPMIFLKAGSCATVNSPEIKIPPWTEELHHEVELALKFSGSLQIIEGAVALDLTERNIQAEAKSKGNPWTLAKSFSNACPVSAFFSVRNLETLEKLQIKLWVNDELKQSAPLSDWIFKPSELIEYLMEHFPVCGGDLLLTGTPAGVGPLRRGDKVIAEITGEIRHQWVVR
jgi:2-keto-4-pentenoate hydratase/2-oxohepta-3-ene-1,7-dioic acid hydratase in catechol pathway